MRRAQMTANETVAYLQKNAPLGETERFRQMDRREAFFRTRQYSHQRKDWNGRDADQLESISAEAIFPAGYVQTGPAEGLLARDKRPTAPTNKAKVIVRRYTAMLFSEKRLPQVRVAGDPDTEAFLNAVREAAHFWPQMRAARNLGGAVGSVAMLVSVRDGAFQYEVVNTKNCEPVWKDVRTRTLQGLLIMWRYQRQENVFDEKNRFTGTKMVDYVYRRIVTEMSDIVYQDCKLEDAGTSWNELARVDHSLGFFPGVWVQNTAEADDVDGECDCEGAFQTIDTNDRLLAQCNYGALNNLDPTAVLAYDTKAVAATGAAGGVVQKGSDNSLHVGQGGSAAYMEMTGSGIEVALKLSDKFEKNITDITGMVFLDDKDMAAAQSAKAIEFRFEPTLTVADDLRAQYGPAVIRLMRITETIARRFSGTTIPLSEGRTGKFVFDLPPKILQVEREGKVVEVLQPHKLGPGGYVSLKWGPYFSPTADDEQKTISNAAAANAAGFVAKATAAMKPRKKSPPMACDR